MANTAMGERKCFSSPLDFSFLFQDYFFTYDFKMFKLIYQKI